MLKKLRIKFICINMLMVTLMLCVIFSLVFHFTRESLETQSLSMMQELADDPFQLGSPGESNESVRLPYFTLQIGPFGDILAVGGGYFDLSNESFLAELIQTVYSSGQPSGIIEQYHLRYLTVQKRSSQCIVFADMSSELATLDSLTRNCVLTAAASFALFLILSLLLARWAVKPVDEAWKQQKQFVSDASHELKTPLTVIMTNAELLQQPDYTDEERARFTGSILTMSQQMRGLVESLLELARADSAGEHLCFEDLNFSETVSNCVLPFEPLYFESGLTLNTEIDEGIFVRGNRQYLCQAADILLDNARKYTEAPGTVSLTLKRHGHGHCLLTVSNPGHLSDEELKNIFKRFYRADKARSRDGSYGLGLSIAESAVTLHKGKIWAESREGEVLFHIQLPILERV